MRLIGRILGTTFRAFVWLMCWPLGWVLSDGAKKRRRHNQVIRTIKQSSYYQGPYPPPMPCRRC